MLFFLHCQTLAGATATNRLKFKAYGSVANSTFDIGYLTDINDISTFQLIQQATTLTTGATTFTQFIIKPTNIPSTATNLVFRNSGAGTGALTINIDDLVWEPNTDPITVPYVMENFDANSNLPSGWLKVPGIAGAVFINTATTLPNPTGTNALQMSGTSAAAYSMVALPPVSNLADGTNLLKLNVRASVIGVKLDVGYLTDLGDPGSFQLIKSIDTKTNTSFETVEPVVPGQKPGATPYLVLRNPGLPAGTLFIDNVSWEKNTVISCPEVTAFGTSAVSTTSADLSWTAGGGPGESWQYAIKDDATLANPFSLTPVDVPSASAPLSATISNLTPGTSYRVWLRSKCTGDFGAWIGPLTFTTPCVSIAGFTQNFDAIPIATPACWNKLIGYSSVAAGNSHSGANALSLYSVPASATAANIPVVWAMPAVTNVGAGNFRISFWFKSNLAGGILELGYLTNPADLNSFNQIQTFTATATHTQVTFGLGQFSDSEVLAFRYLAVAGSPTNIYIDDVDVNVNPSPLCGDITDLVATNATNNTASLDWNSIAGQTKWQYAKGPLSASNTTGLTPVDVTVASEVIIDDLSPDTSYKVWVRPKCADGFGVWAGPLTIKTTCTPTDGFTQNFENTTLDQLPVCWTRLGGGKLYLRELTVAGSKAMGLGPTQLPNDTWTHENPVVVSMPPISNASAGDRVLKFMYSASIANSALEIGYLTNVLDPTSFVSFKSITIDDISAFKRAVVQLTAPILSNTIAFRNGSESLSYVYIDDVSWELAPTAVPATCASALTAVPNANCGNFATAISWAEVSDADGYKLSIGTTAGGKDVLNEKFVYQTNYSFTGDFNKTYHYTVKPFNTVGTTVAQCEGQSFVTNANGCYCASVPGNKDGKGLANVKIGATNFVGGAAAYNNFISKPVNLDKNGTANLKLTFDTRKPDGYGPSYNTKAWVDFNDNFVYENSEVVYSGTSGETSDGPITLDGSFPIPATATLGSHSMRIVAQWISPYLSPLTSCTSGDYAVTYDLKINLVTPAANDLASGAALLTVGKTFAEHSVTGSNVNATGSPLDTEPACAGYNGMDSWYKAVVPTSGKVTFEVNTLASGLANTGAAAYSGTPTALTLIECNDSSSAAGDDHPKIALSGRTTGETLYVRVWENGADALGNYAVSAYETMTLGMDSFDTANFAYYPNPVKDVLNISLDQEISEVAVMNILGQRVIAKSVNANQTKIDMSELSKGTYLVKITAGNQSRTIKAVKQ